MEVVVVVEVMVEVEVEAEVEVETEAEEHPERPERHLPEPRPPNLWSPIRSKRFRPIRTCSIHRSVSFRPIRRIPSILSWSIPTECGCRATKLRKAPSPRPASGLT